MEGGVIPAYISTDSTSEVKTKEFLGIIIIMSDISFSGCSLQR